MKIKLMAICFAVLLASHYAYACEAHRIDVLKSGESAGATVASVTGQYSEFDPSSSDDHRFESSTVQFGIGRNLGERWSVQVSVPYLDRELDGESERGIGDAVALGVYRLYDTKNRNVTIDVYAGIKMPTGDAGALKSEAASADVHAADEHHMVDMSAATASPAKHGDEMHMPAESTTMTPADDEEADHHSSGHHLALGSGSWDALAGVIVRAGKGLWSSVLDIQYIVRTEGDYNYKYGNNTFAKAGVYRDMDIWSGTGRKLLAGMETSAEWREESELDGVKQSGTKQTAAYLGPTVIFQANSVWSGFAAYDFPVCNRDEGLDGSAEMRIRLGLTAMF